MEILFQTCILGETVNVSEDSGEKYIHHTHLLLLSTREECCGFFAQWILVFGTFEIIRCWETERENVLNYRGTQDKSRYVNWAVFFWSLFTSRLWLMEVKDTFHCRIFIQVSLHTSKYRFCCVVKRKKGKINISKFTRSSRYELSIFILCYFLH